jgi:hypothetical protein
MVPLGAVSAPYVLKLFDSELTFPTLIGIPGFIVLLMVFRGAVIGVRNIIDRKRGQTQERSEAGRLASLRFELVTWAFAVGSLGFGVGMFINILRAFEIPAYFYAFALPGGVRWVLFIPLMLILILPVLILSIIDKWRYTQRTRGHVYLVIQMLFGIGMIVLWARLEVLAAWAG